MRAAVKPRANLNKPTALARSASPPIVIVLSRIAAARLSVALAQSLK